MKIIITTLFAFICFGSFAQGGWQWAASHGGDVSSPAEVVRHLQTDQWGNVYIAGSINDIYQRDSAGNILYGPNFFPLIHNYGQSDIWIAKYSPTGKKLWQEYAGSGGRDQLLAMTVDNNGNSYITGALSFHLTRPPFMFNQVPISNDSLGTFIAKLDSGGTLQWHRTFGYDTINNGIVYIGVQGLEIINNKLSLFVSPGPGQSLLFNSVIFDEGWHAVELDLNGNFLSKTKLPFKDFISGANNLKPDFDHQGNYYFHGQFPGDTLFLVNDTLVRNSQNVANGIVLAIDSSGNYKWSFISQNSYDPFSDGLIDGDTVFVATQVTLFVNDTIKFGNESYISNGQASQESVLLLMDANSGSVLGLRHNSAGNRSSSSSYGIAANANYMAISGQFNRKMTFSSTTDYLESVSKSSNTNSDAFFALFDRQGNYLCEDMLYTFGSVDGIQKMTFVDSSIYVAGFFNDTLFVQGDTLIASGSNDVFLARYDLPCDKGITVGIKENNNFIKAENGILVYPNPSNGFTNLIGKPVNNTAMLIDISGKVVKTVELDVNSIQQPINLQELKSGVYFLTIIGSDTKQVLKLIRE